MVDNEKNIFKKYRVLWVMVPGIILIHVLWLSLQSDPRLIRNADPERGRLPIFKMYEYLKNSIHEKINISEKESSQNKD